MFHTYALPIGPIVVPFWGSYVKPYKVTPKRNYYGAYELHNNFQCDFAEVGFVSVWESRFTLKSAHNPTES